MNTTRGETITVRNRRGKSSQNVHVDLRAGSNDPRLNSVEVPISRIDDLVHERVVVAKIDVEGCEISAMQGATRLFAGRLFKNVPVEFGGFERWSPVVIPPLRQ